jgi:hypothetical protein
MKHHQARVYFRSYLPGEVHPVVTPKSEEVDDRWRDETLMDFAHDSHAKWEVLTLTEMSDAAAQEALQKAHPTRFLVIDKISWLDEE